MRPPLTDEELDRIYEEVKALAERAKKQYPKRKNESQSRYNHRIDLIISRWIDEEHDADTQSTDRKR